MRNNIFPLVFASFILLAALAGCSSRAVIRSPFPAPSASKGLPPGQAKKVYGHQSARAFAPGQQKKNTYYPAATENEGHPKKGKKKK